MSHALVFLISVVVPAAVHAAGPTLAGVAVQASGGVSVLSENAQTARLISGGRDPIYLNDTITTDSSGRAHILLLDETNFEIGPNSSLLVDDFVYDPSTRLGKLSVSVLQGVFRFVTGHIGKSNPQNEKVKLPLAVIGVFGTDFMGDVERDRNTVVLKDGRISVGNSLGSVIVDTPDYAVIILRGEAPAPPFAAPGAILEGINSALDRGAQPSRGGNEKDLKPNAPAKPSSDDKNKGTFDFKMDARTEVALGLSKDAVQAAAAMEARNAEYMEGKTMVDAFGKRVRLDEYIVRPAADTFKFVVLNSRYDSFNYFYYQAQFNQTLPATLAPALRYLNGKTGSAPNFYIVNAETGRSNTIDKIQEDFIGGHLVSAPLAQDTVIYDPGSNTFNTVTAGTPFWSTLFNNYSYKIDGTEKFGFQPMNTMTNVVNSYDYSADGFMTRILGGGAQCGAAGCATAGPVTCTAQSCETAARPSSVSTPDGSGVLHDRATISYAANGTAEAFDSYVVDNMGNVAAAAQFGGITSGQSYKNTLLKFNYEQVITASEFQGRKIDLVVEPKILVESGVIQ